MMNTKNKLIKDFIDNFHPEDYDCMDSSLKDIRCAVKRAVKSVDKKELAHDLVTSYTTIKE